MGNRICGFILFLFVVSLTWANQIHVTAGDVSDLMQKAANAQAGDTIWVPAGDYDVGSVSTFDQGVRYDGKDKGLLWLGKNNGTAEHPIILVGEDPSNPPSIHGNINSSLYQGHVIHIVSDYVILKNLKVHSAVRAITIDHGMHVTVEDCELFHTKQEVVHIRDSSSYVTLNRNNIHDSGNEKGTYGEGIYVGSDKDVWWSADDPTKTYWGTRAVSNNGEVFDWRVNNTKITCNIIHGVSAEDIDIKEGSSYATIAKNMFSGDSIQLKPNSANYDNSFVEVKGIRNTIVGNYLYTANNSKIDRYIEEVYRGGTDSNVPDSLTAEKYPVNAYQWCDNSGTDMNQCDAGDNMFINYIGEVRNLCEETFEIPEKPIVYSGAYQDVPEIPSVAETVVLKLEAEDAEITPIAASSCGSCSNEAAVKEYASASGEKYVAMGDGSIKFTVNAEQAGKYNLSIHYSFTNSDLAKYKGKTFVMNGMKMNELRLMSTGATDLTFADEVIGVWLSAGENTLEIGRGWGDVNLDYIQFVGTGTPVVPEFPPSQPEQSIPQNGKAVVTDHFAQVLVLDKMLYVKVPAWGAYNVMVFDYNGNRVNKLRAGSYVVKVSAPGYSSVTPVVVK